MSHLILHLFGPPRIELDGLPVEIEHRKSLALLAYLAVTRQSYTRETLATLLWPKTDSSRAFANLRHILWELNQVVGNGWVHANRDTVSLNLEADLWLDVVQFRRLLTSLGELKPEDARGVPLLTEAVALYPDHFLAGFSLKDAPDFDEWIFFEAEGLRRDLVRSLQMLVRFLSMQGQAETAIPHARRLVALDPVDEEAHRQLMSIYEQAGQHHLALRQYHACMRYLRDELGVDPEPQTAAIYEKLRVSSGQQKQSNIPTSKSHRRSNLPVQLTSLIGRETQLAELKTLLDSRRVGEAKEGLAPGIREAHLITLTGAGGIGKTRLALSLAAELLDVFPDGVWLVDLASISDPALVMKAVAVVLDIHEHEGVPILSTVIDSLRSKSTLLVLDTCEHVVEACAQLAEALLQACPNVRLLVGSRETLGLRGEVVYHVPVLSIPDSCGHQSSEALLHYESVQLFVDRARTTQASFVVTDANAPMIAHICQRLDGIPLSIELAAARMSMLSVDQIVPRLEDRFRLLKDGGRAAYSRHQTLRALIDWSFNLLSISERTLLQRLAVFAGGWTLEAAEVVCAGHEISNSDVLDLLTKLVNKSLVVVGYDQAGNTRYRLLETIQHYVTEVRPAADDWEGHRDRHLDYFVELADRAELELSGPHGSTWLKCLERELGNLQTALVWSVEHNTKAASRAEGRTIAIERAIKNAVGNVVIHHN